MIPVSDWRIRIVDQECECLSSRRRIIPGELGREISAVASELFLNVAAIREAWTREGERYRQILCSYRIRWRSREDSTREGTTDREQAHSERKASKK